MPLANFSAEALPTRLICIVAVDLGIPCAACTARRSGIRFTYKDIAREARPLHIFMSSVREPYPPQAYLPQPRIQALRTLGTAGLHTVAGTLF